MLILCHFEKTRAGWRLHAVSKNDAGDLAWWDFDSDCSLDGEAGDPSSVPLDEVLDMLREGR